MPEYKVKNLTSFDLKSEVVGYHYHWSSEVGIHTYLWAVF